jgi:hypothetical protein
VNTQFGWAWASLGKLSASPKTDQNADPGYTIVGRTPDGKPCDLKAAGLPGSGENGEFGDTGIVSYMAAPSQQAQRGHEA